MWTTRCEGFVCRSFPVRNSIRRWTGKLPHMLSPRFEMLFRRLLGAFLRYDDMTRQADTVVSLAAARAQLEDVRGEIAGERASVMGLGRSRARDEDWRDVAAAARSELFTMAHTSN